MLPSGKSAPRRILSPGSLIYEAKYRQIESVEPRAGRLHLFAAMPRMLGERALSAAASCSRRDDIFHRVKANVSAQDSRGEAVATTSSAMPSIRNRR